jgi:thiol:disulfide interchange protein
MDEIPQEDAFSGIFVSKSGAFPAVAIEKISLEETAAPAEVKGISVEQESDGLLWICFSLFIGGLILNLMPCVFPVIGIKIMGFVQQAGHDRKKIAAHGFIFTLGVLLSFWILAAALYFGGLTSWGNQLQDPRVIFVTLLVMFLFGLNLFGVFEIGTTATGVGGSLIQKQGIAGTFFSGVLATLIATPCSGPFLGVSIATASKLPAVPFFIAFTSMAIGLSLPYLILSIFPALVEKLPRPGMWMESFKQGMSFLLFAAAGFFLWVYSAQVFEMSDGRKGLWVMLGLSLVAAGAWVYGRWTQPYRGKGPRFAARIIALAFLIAGVGMGWPWPAPDVTEIVGKPKIEWHPWSQEEEDRLLAAGQPVYIDFTARWCVTCQTNKSIAYSPEVVELMKTKNIVALRADKTKPSPTIDAKLLTFGRNSIPVNVLLVPGNPTPVITNEILTPGDLTELFNKALP